MKIRIARWSLGLVLSSLLACSSSSTDFCSQKVTINYPPAVDGGCHLDALAADGGLHLTVIVPANTTACEQAMKICSSGDKAILTDRVNCANDAGMNPPACISGQEHNWISQVDGALGTCIAQNQVSSECQGGLQDAGI